MVKAPYCYFILFYYLFSLIQAIPALKSRLCWIMAHCWYKQLPLPLKSRVDDMGFKDFFSIEPFRVDQYLISALSERWRNETHTFHLPPGELTISLEDMVQCWGLRVVGKPMFSEPEYSNPDRNRVLFRQFFGFRPDAKGAMIPLSWLYSIYCPVKARELSREFQLPFIYLIFIIYIFRLYFIS